MLTKKTLGYSSLTVIIVKLKGQNTSLILVRAKAAVKAASWSIRDSTTATVAAIELVVKEIPVR